MLGFQQFIEDDKASLVSLKLKFGIAFQVFPESFQIFFTA